MELQQCPHSLCKQTVLRKDFAVNAHTCAEARTVRLRQANPAPGDITWIHAGGRKSLLAALFSGPSQGHCQWQNILAK